ncbi:MAG: ATP-binding protein [Candidatus Solibacter sp.]
MKKVLLAWSSGKDSAWTLHALHRQNIEVSALLTTLNEAAGRVAMHGVRAELLEQQAEAIGLPVWQVPLPWPCTNEEYEARMVDACRRAVAEGFDTVAFGDLYLQDVRAYRERQLGGTGLTPIFPLWEIPTAQLAREMIAGGLRARLSCVDSRALDPTFSGREFDEALLAALPSTADPCGENGEFHTFVYAGPMFRRPLAIESGEVRNVDGFIYTDLLPVPAL